MGDRDQGYAYRSQSKITNSIEATTNPYSSLVFQSCPSIGEHKDFGLLTTSAKLC